MRRQSGVRGRTGSCSTDTAELKRLWGGGGWCEWESGERVVRAVVR